MRKKLINFIFVFSFSFCLFANNQKQVTEGYKNVSWGTSLKEAKSKLKSISKNSCDQIYVSVERYSNEGGGLIDSTAFLPGYHLAKYDLGSFSPSNQKIDPLIKSKYKVVNLDDGCGLFFNNKLIAYHMGMYESSFSEIQSSLASKYGSPLQISNKVWQYSGKNTIIFHYLSESKHTKDSNQLFYVSTRDTAVYNEAATYFRNGRKKERDKKVESDKMKEKIKAKKLNSL
jgi:hypothetical protein